MTMPEILAAFASESLFDASNKLLKHLGVKCSTQTDEPIPFLELYKDAAKDAGSEVPKPIKDIFGRVDKTYFIGTVDDDTLGFDRGQRGLRQTRRQQMVPSHFLRSLHFATSSRKS